MHGCPDSASETGRLRDLRRADRGRRCAGGNVSAICRSILGLQPDPLGVGVGDGADRRHLALDRAGARRHPARHHAAAPRGDHLLGNQRAGARHHAGAVRGCRAQRDHRPGAPVVQAARRRARMTTDTAMSEPLLRVECLTKSFGGFVALDNISVDIRKGERFGLIGPNGSGKTTLINCISGALSPQKGSVTFAGEDITALPAYLRARRGIARSFQIPRPFRSMTVAENLMVALDFAAGHAVLQSAAHQREAAMQILSRIGLAARADAPTKTLTQVELRKMELARALAARLKLLISDEAMAGLSGAEVDEVLALLLSLAADGIT